MSYLDSWRTHFRHPTYRKNQEPATDKVATFLDEGQEMVIAEIPTGVGKSDIAMSLARSTKNAYIATSINTLVDQYVRDFGSDGDFWWIKGRNNYPCVHLEDETCKTGSESNCPSYDDEECPTPCSYKTNRNRAANSPIALTNLTYFSMGLRSERWGTRNLAVIDEAHNLAGEIMNQVSLEISDRVLKKLMLATTVEGTFRDGNVVQLSDFQIFFEAVVSGAKASIHLLISKGIAHNYEKEIEKLEELIERQSWFDRSVEAGVQWVIQAKKDGKGQHAYVTAKPLHVAFFAQNMFFNKQAQQYLLQSATIVNPKKYAEELGIESYGYVEEGSPFDLGRFRPIFLMDSGSMTFKNLDGTFPDAMSDVIRIMNSYKNSRGIIHTVSYALQKKLWEYLQHEPRCIFMTPDNKQEALEEFAATPGAVLLSPSLMEGFDGKGDLLRFQVIMKLPYASLGDLQVKMKADLDQEWYTWQCVKSVIQALGRGMRSEDDWCDTYIIDSAFKKFADYNLPKEIKKTMYESPDVARARLRKMAQILV